MTTEQLRQARMAVDTLYDVTQHMGDEPPIYVTIALERLDRWMKHGRLPSQARRRLEDED